MTTPTWLTHLLETAAPAPALFTVVVVVYLLLIAMLAVIGALHPDPDHRAAAYRVLGLLVGQGRPSGPSAP